MVLRDGASHDVETRAQLDGERGSSRTGAGGLAHDRDATDDVIERGRVERDHLGTTAQYLERVLHRAGWHRAHLAEVLGEDQIGLDVANARRVERVDRLAVGDTRAHCVVDLLRGERIVGGERGSGYHLLRARFGREVALEGDAIE